MFNVFPASYLTDEVKLSHTGVLIDISIHPSIIYLSKTSKHINRSSQFKNTCNIGLDAKVHVRLFNRLHVAHKNNNKIEMIYNHITAKYTYTQTRETLKKI